MKDKERGICKMKSNKYDEYPETIINGFSLSKILTFADIYSKGNKHIVFVRGFNTDVLVAEWKGEELDADDLPNEQHEGWKDIAGFNVEADPEGGYNWIDYEKSVKKILREYTHDR